MMPSLVTNTATMQVWTQMYCESLKLVFAGALSYAEAADRAAKLADLGMVELGHRCPQTQQGTEQP